MENKALVCIDFINDIVTEKGKLSGKGYLTFIEENNTLSKVKELQDKFRSKGYDIFHIKISFSENYIEHPINSPLFGKAKEFKALQGSAWGTEFSNLVAPEKEEKVITKRRVSAFYSTDLETTLRIRQIKEIYFAGVATDLAIESAVRDAHDRDFNATVVEDCCIAANSEDHKKSLITLQKISKVVTLADITF